MRTVSAQTQYAYQRYIPNLSIENKIYGPYIDAIMRLEMREIGEDGDIGADKSTFLRFV